MVAPFGLGRVGVTGPHPEAPARWYQEAELATPRPLPFDLGYNLVETTIRSWSRALADRIGQSHKGLGEGSDPPYPAAQDVPVV
jgi:hypothetical protein